MSLCTESKEKTKQKRSNKCRVLKKKKIRLPTNNDVDAYRNIQGRRAPSCKQPHVQMYVEKGRWIPFHDQQYLSPGRRKSGVEGREREKKTTYLRFYISRHHSFAFFFIIAALIRCIHHHYPPLCSLSS